MGHQAIASQTKLQRLEKGLGHAVSVATSAAGLIGTVRTLVGAGRAVAGVAAPIMGALAPFGI